MKRRLAIVLCSCAGAASLLKGVADDFTLRSDVRLVQLDISVRDKKGEDLAGLRRDDFKVRENGRIQSISEFEREDLPATVGILIDESFSTRSIRSDILGAAQGFIRQCNPHDEFFVLNFNDRVTAGLPHSMLFSDNPAILSAALRHGKAEGKTALYDAIEDGLTEVKLGQRHRRALVVISDGGDTASRHSRREIFALLEASAATVYAIGLFETSDLDQDPRLLKQLTEISGGDAYFPNSGAEMQDACDKIAKDLRSRYTVGYVPPKENGGALRRIKVSVTAPNRAKVNVLTRGSYIYDDSSK